VFVFNPFLPGPVGGRKNNPVPFALAFFSDAEGYGLSILLVIVKAFFHEHTRETLRQRKDALMNFRLSVLL